MHPNACGCVCIYVCMCVCVSERRRTFADCEPSGRGAPLHRERKIEWKWAANLRSDDSFKASVLSL